MQSIVANFVLGPGNVSSIKRLKDESYFHANAYLRLNTSQNPGASSQHREMRAKELPVCLSWDADRTSCLDTSLGFGYW